MPELPPDSDPGRPPDDFLDPDLRPVAERLRAERPVPRAAFRAELRAHLAEAPRERPRIRRLILAYGTSGFALLAVATLGVAGAGPLAA